MDTTHLKPGDLVAEHYASLDEAKECSGFDWLDEKGPLADVPLAAIFKWTGVGLTGLPGHMETTAEVADRIVRAVNAYADLLAVCEALPLDREFEDAADYKDNAARFDRAMRLARAAIAKAKGGAA